MINSDDVQKAHLAMQKLEQRYRYLLRRAADIDSGRALVEQRFGIILDAGYYRDRAEELLCRLTQMGCGPNAVRAA